MATYAICAFDATDDSGNLLTNVTVEVRRTPDLTLEPVYSDRAGTVSLGNSFTVTDGKVAFYCAGGAFKITLTSGSYTRTRYYVAVGRAAETDLTIATPQGAYSSGATYALGDLVSVVNGSNVFLFISLQNTNLNHTPDSSTPGDTSWWMYVGSPTGSDFLDLALYNEPVLTSSESVFRAIFAGAATFPAGLTGSQFIAGVAATGSTILTLKRNGSSIGTITFGAASTTATASFATAVTFFAGDVLEVVGPASADATLAKISLTLRGTRDSTGVLGQSGTATLDFGSFPGSTDATVTITGITRIAAGSLVEVWLWPGSGTSDHTDDEHKAVNMRVKASDVVAGTGFTIFGMTTDDDTLDGQWNVAWRWS